MVIITLGRLITEKIITSLKERNRFKKKLSLLLPDSVYSEIDFTEHERVRTHVTSDIRYTYVLKRKAFEIVQGAKLEDIKRVTRLIDGVLDDPSFARRVKKLRFYRYYHRKRFSEKLYEFLDKDNSIVTSLTWAIDNIDKRRFKRYFLKTMALLIPSHILENYLYFKLDVVSNDFTGTSTIHMESIVLQMSLNK